jgi:hypothetical protein
MEILGWGILPGCPNIATRVLGRVTALRFVAAVCDEHAP